MSASDRGISAVGVATARKWLPYLLIFGVTALLYLLSGMERAEYRLMDARFQLSSRPASGNLVVVTIDAGSLRELDRWPWPRDYHAKIIRTLIEGGADRVAFAVDFSSRSSDAADRQLESALALADDHGRPVILPLFKQFKDSADPDKGLILTRPLPVFEAHVDLAFTNVQPAADSLIRRIQIADKWQGNDYLTLAARLAGVTDPSPALFFVDYGIEVSSVPHISFSDLYFGRVDPSIFKGKKVLIGATAVELGDQMAVPRYRSVPGPMLEALSYESIVQKREIKRLAALPVLVTTFLISLFGGPWLASRSWRRGFLLLFGFFGVCFAFTVGVQRMVPVSVDISPWLMASVLSFLFGLVRNIDRSTFRAFISGMAAAHTRAVMRGMIENSFDGVIVVNSRGTVEMFNPAAARMFQVRSVDVVGKAVETLFSASGGDTAHELADMLDEIKAPKPNESAGKLREMDLRRRDGTAFPAEVAISQTSLRVSGTHRQERRTSQRGAFVYIVRDISERREADRKERSLRSQLAHVTRLTTMGEMAAGIAHEINQPLTAINTYAGGLRRRLELDPLDRTGLSEGLDLISAQAERAGGIIRRIRGFAKKDEQERKSIAINPAVSDAINLVLADAGNRDIEIVRELAPNLPLVWADIIQIQQVVVNLVRNAVEAVSKGAEDGQPGKRLSIRVLSRKAGDRHVQVIVADTGSGIPADVMPRLFEPFFSTKSSGMGIGLLMSKSIIEDHGGEIRIESVEGLGTTVSFSVQTAESL